MGSGPDRALDSFVKPFPFYKTLDCKKFRILFFISDPECSYVPVFVGSYIQIQIEIFACIFSVIYTYITDIQPRYSIVYMSYDFVICI